MKKYAAILALLLFSAVAMSQVSISYSIGYGTNNMGDMKDLLERKYSVLKEMIGGVEITDNFATPLIHNIEISYIYQKEEFGAQISVMNTKGTIIYTEGSYLGGNEESYKLKGMRLGTFYRRPFAERPIGKKYKLVFFGEISPGVTISTIKYAGMIPSANNIDVTDANTSKVSISILPFVGTRLNFTESIGVQIAVGYDLSFGSKLDDVHQTKIDWSGVRVKGGIYYIF